MGPVPATTPAALELTVAGVCLAFEAHGGLAVAPPAFQYPAFRGGPARRRIPVRVRAAPMHIGAPDMDTAFDTGDAWRLLAAGPRRRLEMSDRARAGRGLWQVDWTQPLTRAEARVDPALVDGGVIRHLAQYPLDQVLLTESLLDDGGVLLHAAGGLTPAGGLLLAGVSGAGKSTVTRALHGRAGFRFFSDDRLFARRTPTEFEIHGTPWAGDAGVAVPLHAPLAGICLLRQAGHVALEPLRPATALERLLPLATLPWYDRERVGAALELCAALVTAVPCFDLAFTRDGAALAAVLSDLPDAA